LAWAEHSHRRRKDESAANAYDAHLPHAIHESFQHFLVVTKSKLEFASVCMPDLVQQPAMVLFENAQEQLMLLRS
jgi:hypothetical protein